MSDSYHDVEIGRMVNALIDEAGGDVTIQRIAGIGHSPSASVRPSVPDRVGVTVGTEEYEGSDLNDALRVAFRGEFDVEPETVWADTPDPRDATIAALTRERDEARVALEAMRERKRGAYEERDKVVAAFAAMARAFSWRVSLGTHVGEWEDDWRNIVFIETPYGQVSWHYHDSERALFWMHTGDPGVWDGHSTPEKYDRLWKLTHDGVTNPLQREVEGLRAVKAAAEKVIQSLNYWKSDAPAWPCCFPVRDIDALRAALKEKTDG